MIKIEIILVNDKSNDGSIKIIKNIQKTDRRIKLHFYSLNLKKGKRYNSSPIRKYEK